MQGGAAAEGTCWGPFVSGSGGELGSVRDRLCPRLRIEGQDCDPPGTAPLPQAKPSASPKRSTPQPRACIRLWAFGQEEQTARRSDREGIISLYVLQGPSDGATVPGLGWCSPHGQVAPSGEGRQGFPISLGTALTIAHEQSTLHPSTLGVCAL